MLIEVTEPSQAGEARRRAVEFAEDLHLGETRYGAVGIVATELATNLVKHAANGKILLQRLHENGNLGLRILAVDKGPGIRDISKALQDGHSTVGTMGAGLGAIRRLSDIFEVYSATANGTLIRAEFWQGKQTPSENISKIQTGAVSEPIRGEEVCGDGWGVRTFADSLVVMVVDGLGHGVLAAEAAQEAEKTLARSEQSSPYEIIHAAHAALKKTRGAAIGIAKIQHQEGLLCFAGVGNISAAIVAPGVSRSLASHNGILGHQMQRVQEFTYPWNAESTLVMHSDGLYTRWDLERYPGVWSKHPSLIAAVLHRDFYRGRDDVTVVVARGSKVHAVSL
ncbi:MAG: anti-sigma regulatory factor [Terriglobales bacterium]